MEFLKAQIFTVYSRYYKNDGEDDDDDDGELDDNDDEDENDNDTAVGC